MTGTTDKGEVWAVAKSFKGHPIRSEKLAIGVGGQFKRDEDFPDVPERSRIQAEVWFDYDNVKYKFLESGGVEETLILTLDTKSFRILVIEEQPEQQELPETETEPEEA